MGYDRYGLGQSRLYIAATIHCHGLKLRGDNSQYNLEMFSRAYRELCSDRPGLQDSTACASGIGNSEPALEGFKYLDGRLVVYRDAV